MVREKLFIYMTHEAVKLEKIWLYDMIYRDNLNF